VTTKGKNVPYDVRFENRGSYLLALITGRGEQLETTRATWRSIAAECKARGFTRLLILEDIEGQLPFMDQYAFADGLKQIGFDGIAVAFVDAQPEQYANNKFAEDVAANRGVHGRMFQTVAEAEAWLLSRWVRPTTSSP
jgi:hypothetical protein